MITPVTTFMSMKEWVESMRFAKIISSCLGAQLALSCKDPEKDLRVFFEGTPFWFV